MIQTTGDAMGQSPSRCSENVIAPSAGKKTGAFHHAVVNGTVVAFHHRIHVFSRGSPASGMTVPPGLAGIGHSSDAATARNPQKASRGPNHLTCAASNLPEDISMVDRVSNRPLPPAVFHILLALADGDQHGYAIIRAISANTDGRVRIGPGTLYRSIQQMLEAGLLTEVSERPAPDEDDERRRYYRITALGRKVARAEAERLAGLVRLARASGLARGKV